MTSMIQTQEKMAEEIAQIRASMVEIVRIEERQSNQKEALDRAFKQITALDEEQNLLSRKVNSIHIHASIIAAGLGLVLPVLITVGAQYLFGGK